MTRDTRNNLIFVAVLIALMLPGAVILVRKKMQPGERPIGSPDPVRRTTAYMDPYPAESVERLAPVLTLQWVGALALEGAPDGAARVTRSADATLVVPVERPRETVGASPTFGVSRGGSPGAQVMSDGRGFQVVARGESGGAAAGGGGWLRAIVWDERFDPANADLKAEAGGAPARVLAARSVDMPKAVRHDLQDVGFVLPPERVAVLDLEVPAAAKEVTITWRGRTERALLP